MARSLPFFSWRLPWRPSASPQLRHPLPAVDSPVGFPPMPVLLMYSTWVPFYQDFLVAVHIKCVLAMLHSGLNSSASLCNVLGLNGFSSHYQQDPGHPVQTSEAFVQLLARPCCVFLTPLSPCASSLVWQSPDILTLGCMVSLACSKFSSLQFTLQFPTDST